MPTPEPLPPELAGVDPALIADLVAANHVLANEGVLDGFGHVSVRDPRDPGRYLMSRSISPMTVAAADVMLFDLESSAIEARGRGVYVERFIHGEVYKARGDVNAVVHSHSPSVIPFGVTEVPLRAIFHNGAFLGDRVPVWEIRDAAGEQNDMLVSRGDLGRSLATTLGAGPVALMRGHGDVVVGPSLEVAVFRAIYTEVNARLQMQALMIAAGGPINYLNSFEQQKAHGTARPWRMWKAKVGA